MTANIPNTIEGYLQYSINHFYSALLSKHNFRFLNKKIEGMGGIYNYGNDTFCIQIINDRGIIDSTIAPTHNLSKYYDWGLLYGLVFLTQNPKRNQWEKRLAFSKNLSCAEEAAFIDSNYALLKDLFSVENFTKTQTQLKEVGKQRGEILFGK